jgi:hypothetical protein
MDEPPKRFRWESRVDFEAGPHTNLILTLVPTDLDDPEGVTISEALAHPPQGTFADPLTATRKEARAVYERHGLPTGHLRWCRRRQNGDLTPITDGEPAERKGYDQVCESDLWQYGHEPGSAAWAAGQVLHYAEMAEQLLTDIAGGIVPPAVLAEELLKAAFELGRSREVMLDIADPRDSKGRTSADLRRRAAKSNSGPADRIPQWEARAADILRQLDEQGPGQSYYALAAGLRAVHERTLKQGQTGLGLPTSDKAVTNGVARMAARGVIPPRRKNLGSEG